MMMLRVCPSSLFNLRPLHLSTSSTEFPFCPSIRRELRLVPSRSSSSSFRRMESSPASETDSLGEDTQNQTDEGDKIKRKLEEFNWDHSFVNELPGDPRSDVISRKVITTFLWLRLNEETLFDFILLSKSILVFIWFKLESS